MFLYLFLFLVAGESMMLCQLTKVPLLYSHYAAHKQKDPSVDLLDFMSMHYWGDDLHDNDQTEDMQLPFKRYDLNAFSFIFISDCRIAVEFPRVWLITPVFGLNRPESYSISYLSSHFRPPRA